MPWEIASGGQGPKGDTGAAGAAGATGATGATGAAGPANLVTSVLAADATSVTATMAASGLTVNVVAGHRYAFRVVLMLNDSSTASASGGKFDFDGGSAVLTDFRVWFNDTNFGVYVPTAYVTSQATDITNNGGFIDDVLFIDGALEPSSSGTFAIRFAQNVRVDGTLTLFRGSSLTIWEP